MLLAALQFDVRNVEFNVGAFRKTPLKSLRIKPEVNRTFRFRKL